MISVPAQNPEPCFPIFLASRRRFAIKRRIRRQHMPIEFTFLVADQCPGATKLRGGIGHVANPVKLAREPERKRDANIAHLAILARPKQIAHHLTQRASQRRLLCLLNDLDMPIMDRKRHRDPDHELLRDYLHRRIDFRCHIRSKRLASPPGVIVINKIALSHSDATDAFKSAILGNCKTI
jgi:hypothetical protein